MSELLALEVLLMRKRVLSLVGVAVSLCALTGCGSTPPAAPAPVPTATPTPTPAPTPTPRALSVIPPCPLPPSNPANPDCTKPPSILRATVSAAVDRAITERPELFDLEDVNGGPRILNIDAYMTAVVAAINEAGYCGLTGPEGEIAVKSGNSFSEQWIIASRAGWGSPTSNWVIRKYVGACSPSTF
jgi:hypothetical protein